MKKIGTLFALTLLLTLAFAGKPIYAAAPEPALPGGSAEQTALLPGQDGPAAPYSPLAGGQVGIESISVTFVGLWGGSCKAWGTDYYHSSPVAYTAGTLRMTVDGQTDVPGYCIDVQHSLGSGGSTWQANIYAARPEALCEANWILANYDRSNPGPGLTSAEEGAAIQAAIWHTVEGFQPVWSSSYWCGKQAVYDRTLAIMAAADGQCLLMPASLDLTAAPTLLHQGETSDLTATVLDQKGSPLAGQIVSFSKDPADAGTLGLTSGDTDAAGQVLNTITFDGIGTIAVTASVSGQSATAVLEDVAGVKQRLIVIKTTPFTDQDPVSVTWDAPPTAIELLSFEARGKARSIVLTWETASEIDNLGFNLYRAEAADGAQTRLNADLIPSQNPGSPLGGSYRFVDNTASAGITYYYWLEAVDINGATSRHGPVSASLPLRHPAPIRPRPETGLTQK